MVLGEPAVAGVAPAEVAAAWSVARRAARVTAGLVTRDSVAACGDGPRVVAAVDGKGDVSLSRPDQAGAGVWRLALEPLAPRDRSRALARALASAATAGAEDRLAPIVVFAPAREEAPPAWVFGVALGAAWEPGLGDEAALLGADLELRAATLDDRLQLGVRAGWRPAVAAPAAAVPTDVATARFALLGGWGWRLGPLEARVAGGVELTWRRSEARPPTRFGVVTVDDLGVAVPLEARLTWEATRALALELAIGGRVYLGGAARTWLGDGVVDAPVGGLEGALRLCWWWNR